MRFTDVTILRNLTPEQLAEGIKSNYMSGHTIIKNDIYSSAPTAEIQYLLNKIIVNDDRELFHINASCC